MLILVVDKKVENAGKAQEALRGIIIELNQGRKGGEDWELVEEKKTSRDSSETKPETKIMVEPEVRERNLDKVDVERNMTSGSVSGGVTPKGDVTIIYGASGKSGTGAGSGNEVEKESSFLPPWLRNRRK